MCIIISFSKDAIIQNNENALKRQFLTTINRAEIMLLRLRLNSYYGHLAMFDLLHFVLYNRFYIVY